MNIAGLHPSKGPPSDTALRQNCSRKDQGHKVKLHSFYSLSCHLCYFFTHSTISPQFSPSLSPKCNFICLCVEQSGNLERLELHYVLPVELLPQISLILSSSIMLVALRCIIVNKVCLLIGISLSLSLFALLSLCLCAGKILQICSFNRPSNWHQM